MYITNFTDYDIMTDDYNNSVSENNNCTLNGKNNDIIIPTLFLTKPCGLSFFCFMNLMIHTLIKPLFNNKR